MYVADEAQRDDTQNVVVGQFPPDQLTHDNLKPTVTDQQSPPPRRLCFHRRLFVCLFVCLQDYAKTTRPIFKKFGGKVAHGIRKKRRDFGGKLDHVTLGLQGQGYGYSY